MDILAELKKAYPDKHIEKIETLKMYGVWLVPSRYLEHELGVTGRTITGWQKKGLPVYKHPLKNMKMFNYHEAIAWHNENIDHSKSKRRW